MIFPLVFAAVMALFGRRIGAALFVIIGIIVACFMPYALDEDGRDKDHGQVSVAVDSLPIQVSWSETGDSLHYTITNTSPYFLDGLILTCTGPDGEKDWFPLEKVAAGDTYSGTEWVGMGFGEGSHCEITKATGWKLMDGYTAETGKAPYRIDGER